MGRGSLIFMIATTFLAGVLITGLIGGTLYLALAPTADSLLNELTFGKFATTFGNGVEGGTLWPTDPTTTSIIASVRTLKTFLPLAEWRVSAGSYPEPDLPLFFTLPEPAKSVKTYLAGQGNILPEPGPPDNLIGVLLTPTHVGLKFANGDVPTDRFLTGNDLTGSIQELAMIIVYTAA